MYEKIVLIMRKTRLQALIERFNSRGQARFYIEHSGGDFSDYEREHETYQDALRKLRQILAGIEGLKLQMIERSFLPNFLFTTQDIVIVVGQDGLVVNTAKYLTGQPLIAVNPDPDRFDGILLPCLIPQVAEAIAQVLTGNNLFREITMAEAVLNDGQTVLAFNELFIGVRTHTSARYRLTFGDHTEQHSSSGLIVSTGAGSTGWLSSMFNMAAGIAQFTTRSTSDFEANQLRFDWETPQLMFVVREPFVSQTSQAGLVAGRIPAGHKLIIESQTPDQGVIFSDGVEADYVSFNSGTTAIVQVAQQKTNLYCN